MSSNSPLHNGRSLTPDMQATVKASRMAEVRSQSGGPVVEPPASSPVAGEVIYQVSGVTAKSFSLRSAGGYLACPCCGDEGCDPECDLTTPWEPSSGVVYVVCQGCGMRAAEECWNRIPRVEVSNASA